MRIKAVKINNRKKAFEIKAGTRVLDFPYAKASPAPSADNGITKVYVDKELAKEAITYVLESGDEGFVHIEQILEYHKDPDYLNELMLYRMTLKAQELVESSKLSKREIIRRLGTSASQFYRLMDQTNYKKSIGGMLAIFHILDCEVDLVVTALRAKKKSKKKSAVKKKVGVKKFVKKQLVGTKVRVRA
ncbi:hypothetical protein JYT83_00320 [bacterium AH-315-F18]|nr:hypothetical protein [bacterium AH-315-F18]